MKCLSIKQPFADLIANGKKKYEIRSWRTSYRGELLICSSKIPFDNSIKQNNGVTICIVDLIDIVPFNKNMTKLAHIKYIENHWAWILSKPIKIKNIPIKGQQGLFDFLPINSKEAVILRVA